MASKVMLAFVTVSDAAVELSLRFEDASAAERYIGSALASVAGTLAADWDNVRDISEDCGCAVAIVVEIDARG